MINRHKVSSLIKQLRKLLEPDTNILFAYLYGSFVTDPELLGSDIDVGVYLKPGDLNAYVKKEDQLTAFLVSHLHNDRIDLRIINTLPLLLKYSILRDGILIFSRDERERVDFETTSMIRFFELKPHFDEYKRILSRTIGDSE